MKQHLTQEDCRLTSQQAQHLMTLGCQFAEKHGYLNNGTAMIGKHPTEDSPLITITVVSPEMQENECVHVVLVLNWQQHTATLKDIHCGRGAWANHLQCKTCDTLWENLPEKAGISSCIQHEQTLYTFGYLQTKAERIITELIVLKTPVIDVRYNPTSRNYRYTQAALKSRLGVLYYHVVELGNELYKEALTGHFSEPHVRLHAPEKGLARLQNILDMYGRAAIFCACASGKTCHRTVIARLAQERLGVQIVHL